MDTFIIIGLGNPGREYRKTRHNIGFMVLDQLAERLNARFSRMQSRALVADSNYMERKIILAKPQTFMNVSGQSVKGIIHFYKIPLENIMIVHDDLDLPIGTIRIRADGGSAGQKGMMSIIEHLGTDEFPRLRMGIGHPPGQMQVPDYVLKDFSESDLQNITDTLRRAEDACLMWVTNGIDAAMNKFNGLILES